MVVSDVQPLKDWFRASKSSGRSTASREAQLSNASLPMFVTVFGMLTDMRLPQFRKAEMPMSLTLSGITTLVRLSQL